MQRSSCVGENMVAHRIRGSGCLLAESTYLWSCIAIGNIWYFFIAWKMNDKPLRLSESCRGSKGITWSGDLRGMRAPIWRILVVSIRPSGWNHEARQFISREWQGRYWRMLVCCCCIVWLKPLFYSGITRTKRRLDMCIARRTSRFIATD